MAWDPVRTSMNARDMQPQLPPSAHPWPYIRCHALDLVAAQITHLALTRNVAPRPVGWPTWPNRVSVDPELRDRLAAAIRGRHDSLTDTARLNAGVYDVLVVLAARPGNLPG